MVSYVKIIALLVNTRLSDVCIQRAYGAINHCYIYIAVAHIRVLGCRGPVLKVDIVECQNIICGVCPPRGYYKIAHCSDCLQDCPVNEEFVVAGGKSGDSLYISNYKRGGLFAIQQRYGNWATFVPSQCTDN